MDLSSEYVPMASLETGMAEIRQSPREQGTLRLIARRPAIDEREVLEQGELDLTVGLVGDNWKTRGSSAMPDGSAHPDAQLTLMNTRLADLVSGSQERWILAGDQLFVDFDLSVDNLPPGTRVAIGEAVIEITSKPHTGCDKFMARFGLDALKFVNSKEGKAMRLRGLNARVVQPGQVRVGDAVRKL